MATVVDRSRTSDRLPGSSTRRVSRAPPRRQTEKHTVPTGLSGVPPSGPAIPVIPIPTSASNRDSCAGSERLGHLRRHRTEPRDQTRIHPGERDLGLVRVDDDPAGEIGRGARQLGQPRRHQAAGARLRDRDHPPRRQRRHLRVDRRPVAREQQLAVPLRDEVDQRRVRRLASRLVPRRDLDLAAAQAGRDLERLERHTRLLGRAERVRDLGLGQPVQAHDPAQVRPRARDRRAERAGPDGLRPHLVELARRAGEHDDGRTGTGRRWDHQPRRGPDRIQNRGTPRNDGLLSVRLPDRVGIEALPAMHQRPEDLGDPLLERVVEHHLAAGEATDDLGGQIVRGRPEAAAGHDQRHPLVRHVPERVQQVVRAVADDLDHRGVDAELDQALGQPRPVAVGDDPRQDLGARDQDPGAGRITRDRSSGRRIAHVHVGS